MTYLEIKASVVLLDGYPRTHGQIDEFIQRGGQISATILLLADEDLALSRIVDRSQRLGRLDDSLDVARRRIQNEIANLSALRAHREIGRSLVEINAKLDKTQVAERVTEAVVRSTG